MCSYDAFFTMPERRHLVQTRIFFVPPFVTTLTVCTFGKKIFLLLLFAWLTLLPIIFPLPHISQTLAILKTS